MNLILMKLTGKFQDLVIIRFHSLCLALTLLISSCSTSPKSLVSGANYEVKTWGSMREVLKEGKTSGRITLDEVVTQNSIGVGALSELKGEITLLAGEVFIATGAKDSSSKQQIFKTRSVSKSDQAALLVIAEVPAWESLNLGSCATYSDLETKVAAVLKQRGFDLLQPTPIRIRGVADRVDFHVIAGSCPIADPQGTPPWRGSIEGEPLELVGIYVEESAGKLTHHLHNSHLHVVSGSRSGHVDAIQLHSAELQIPRIAER